MPKSPALPDGHVQIVASDLYSPSLEAIKARLSTSKLIRFNRRHEHAFAGLPSREGSRVYKRAKDWLAQRQAASGIFARRSASR